MKPIHRHVTRFWSEERSLTAFLILLIVEIFVIAPMQFTGFGFSLVNSVLFSLLLLTGLFTLTRRRTVQAVLAIFVALSVATHWAYIFFGLTDLRFLDGLLMLLCTIGLLVVVLWQVYREGPVTAHRIQGAVAAYLLLSVIFAIAYGLLESFAPASFLLPSSHSHAGTRINPSFYYFSVVTLTTTGYGDITAASPFARTLVMMEALIGPLYPAILIARLVSLHVEWKREKRGEHP
ncbi:MAG: potassium channel family protein [Syntrophaceae bacterium]